MHDVKGCHICILLDRFTHWNVCHLQSRLMMEEDKGHVRNLFE